MSNKTNDQNWAAQERLRFIERCAWWRGIVNRQDLSRVFGVSLAQASSDMQCYVELNPGALVYNLRLKRYEASESMTCVLGQPDTELAVRQWLNDENAVAMPAANGCIVRLLQELPARKIDDSVMRKVFMAILRNGSMRIRYESMSQDGATWRRIHPRRIIDSGYRWHVRAWCEEKSDWRDFVLSRIRNAEWPIEANADLPADHAWNSYVTIRLQARSVLNASQRQAVENDYGMRGGKTSIKVRKALEIYARRHLGLPTNKEDIFPLLEEC
jgi:hypothetical protein